MAWHRTGLRPNRVLPPARRGTLDIVETNRPGLLPIDVVEMLRNEPQTRGEGLLPGQRSGVAPVSGVEILFQLALDLRPQRSPLGRRCRRWLARVGRHPRIAQRL